MTTQTGEEETPQQSEISRAFRSLWERHAQSRPSEVVTELRDNRVRCTLADAVKSFEQGPPLAEGAAEDGPAERVPMTAYRSDAMRTVARVTGRRVMALISDRNAETDVARETFILEVHSPKR
jgi:uncharacterized protein YbcI